MAQFGHRIVDAPAQWKQATRGKSLGSACTMAGDSLKRPPAGFDPNHPLVEDLKRKDFALMTREAKPWPGAVEGEEDEDE